MKISSKIRMLRSTLAILLVITSIFLFNSCIKKNYSKEAVSLQIEEIDPGDLENGGDDQELLDHELFDLPPGSRVPLKFIGWNTDPDVGTCLGDDFDGDGIKNADELTTNVWVADYPVVETYVAPPVTMKIEVLEED